MSRQILIIEVSCGEIIGIYKSQPGETPEVLMIDQGSPSPEPIEVKHILESSPLTQKTLNKEMGWGKVGDPHRPSEYLCDGRRRPERD